MTPVIIAQPCALNAKEDYSRCHVVDYEALCMYVCESFPVTYVEMPRATTLISFVCLRVVHTHCRAYHHFSRSKHIALCSVFLSQSQSLSG